MSDAMQERIIQLTSELVAIPSHETEQVAQEFLAGVLEGAGFTCRLQSIEPGRPNLIAVRGEGGTFLCSHIDTHPPHAHPEPFTARAQGEVIVGRGVVDAKGQIAAAVAAAETARDMPATIVITCDEEFGGLGSERLEVPAGPWREEGGIVLEPTNLSLCTAQGGHIDLVIEASAPATHAYAPGPERSPIDVVVDAIESLRVMPSLEAAHPLLPRPRAHLGHLQGGEHLWRTPARAKAEMSIGLVPDNDPETVCDDIRSRLDRVGRTWGVEGASFLYEILDASEAIEVQRTLPVAQRLASILHDPPHAGIASWTDAGNLLVHHQLPCVIFGAGGLESAHSNHEWVDVQELVRLGEVLAELLRTGGTAR